MLFLTSNPISTNWLLQAKMHFPVGLCLFVHGWVDDLKSQPIRVTEKGASECHMERCVSSISCWNNTFIQGEKTLHLAVSAANCWHLWFWWKKHIIPIPTTYIKIWILKSPLFWESWNFTFEMSLQSYLDQNLIGRISIPSSWPERPSLEHFSHMLEGWTNTTQSDDYPHYSEGLTIPGWCRILSINIINSILALLQWLYRSEWVEIGTSSNQVWRLESMGSFGKIPDFYVSCPRILR